MTRRRRYFVTASALFCKLRSVAREGSPFLAGLLSFAIAGSAGSAMPLSSAVASMRPSLLGGCHRVVFADRAREPLKAAPTNGAVSALPFPVEGYRPLRI